MTSKIRTTIKWTCAVATLLLLIIWLASGWFHIGFWGGNPGWIINNGRLQFSWGFPPGSRGGWEIGSQGSFMGFHIQPWFRFESAFICLPIWIFALATAAAALLAWRTDAIARRNYFRGRCSSCAFDLSGLPPGAPCPECGRIAPPHAVESN